MIDRCVRAAAAAVLSACLAASALAQPAPAAASARLGAAGSWFVAPLRFAKETHFTNLEPGARIETPFLLKFGLTGMGIAPTTKAQARTGHHHLLINRDLPLDFSQPLPFNAQYVHFGKGQMETVLELPPGDYVLRLVFADHKHIPNFVYSKPLPLTVTRHRADVDAASLAVRGVQLMLPPQAGADGAAVRVLFHASKLNVSHVALKEPGTGHFRLNVAAEGGAAQRMDFTGGETEAWLRPPPGNYTLRLEFVDNVDPARVLATSAPAALTMKRAGAL